MPLTVSFIMLAWNSEKYLERCVRSIFEKCDSVGIEAEIIVLDNGSTDGSLAIAKGFVASHPDRFILLELGHNTGTTYPRNLGLRRARGRYVCIIDSDTEMGEGKLGDVLDLLAARSEVGLIAPCLVLPDGSVQHSVKRFPTMLHKLLKVPRILFGIRTANADFYGDFPFQEEREVDTAISACWIFRRDLLDTVGFLDERIFYSPEDLDFSIRVRKAGYAILYYPGLKVLHHTQQISHKSPFSRTSRSHLKGLIYYYAKHGGWLFRPSIG